MKLLIISLFCFNTLVSFAAEEKIQQNVQDYLNDHQKADVILTLHQQADFTGAEMILDRTQRIQLVYDQLRKEALRTQETLLDLIKKEGLKFRSFHIINAVLVKDANREQIKKLAAVKSVASVSLDVEATLKLPESESFSPSEINPSEIPDNFKKIGVDKAWNNGYMGLGIVIAGHDSGYKWDHPALKSQYRGSGSFTINHDYNWHDAIHEPVRPHSKLSDCGYNLSAPCDDSGHGTHTMGTMVGYEWNTKTNRIGVAPQSKWIGCRNMDQGTGKASTYIECFEFFLAPYPMGGDPKVDGDPSKAPHIINNSWGCPTAEGCKGNEFVQVIDTIQTAGIIVVASAGNDGPSCGSMSAAPGFYSGKIFSVAAYDHRSGDITSFSSRGPSPWNGGPGPNITAPGNAIRSAVPSGGLGNGLYDYKSGTSMSGPHVAGVIALLWSARPKLIGNIQGTIDLIQKTATPKVTTQTCGNYSGSVIPNAVYGYGIIDAYKAIQTSQ